MREEKRQKLEITNMQGQSTALSQEHGVYQKVKNQNGRNSQCMVCRRKLNV